MKLLRYEKFIHKSELNEGIVRKFYDKVKIKYLCTKYLIENYSINKDGSVDVDGVVFLSSEKLTKLPLKFGKVGNFYCSENKLTSLSGAPFEVGGDFYCPYNQLTSLSGAPREVGGDFYCHYNNLMSLEGSPLEVGGHFDCHSNQLTSLEGSPREVGGEFYCKNNQLTSLEGSPRSVGGNFNCRENQLTSLEGIYKYISGNINCKSNILRDVKGIKDGWRGDFHVEGNPVYEIFKLFPEDRWDEVIEYLNEHEVIRDGKVVILQALELVFHEMGLEVPEIDQIEGYDIQF
jgi:hypothetical protein